MARTGRLNREMKMWPSKAKPGICLKPVNDSLEEFQANIVGLKGTPYESGEFKLEIKVPETYPFCAPTVKFLTPVYHPNIDSYGRICLKTLKPPPTGDWTPKLTLLDVVQEIQLLLKHPNPDDSLMPDIAQEYITDRDKFDETARMLTKKYATTDKTSEKTEENE